MGKLTETIKYLRGGGCQGGGAMRLVWPATGKSVTTCDTNRRAALRCRVTDGQSFRFRLLPTDFTDFDQLVDVSDLA